MAESWSIWRRVRLPGMCLLIEGIVKQWLPNVGLIGKEEFLLCEKVCLTESPNVDFLEETSFC